MTTKLIPIIPRITGSQKTPDVLNLESICIFASTGFFLEKDTYWKGQTALQPAIKYELDAADRIISEAPYWGWHYSPRYITLKQATEEFAHLFERITREQLGEQKVILPLSGGLDSRTQAAALRGQKDVSAFSYEFPGGIPETSYGRAIARAMGFDFKAFAVPPGYLWDNIDHLANLNGCYAEFTHPRQMAFIDAYPLMGDVFFLGHGGDLFFDDMGVPDGLPFDKQLEVILKKIIKKGGMELGNALWLAWGLKGHFKDHLRSRIEVLLHSIDIDNANARIRAFKSLYWVPRWTNVNLQVFSSVRPIALPYYHDDICRFICTIPERYLAGRQIQIEYLKMVAPELARIPWQAQRPFNLYNYQWNKTPWNLPYRVADKATRTLRNLSGKPFVQRNWELQFLGDENDRHLRKYLFHNEVFRDLVPTELVADFYKKFNEADPVYYSHPISMLLTLSVFSRKFWQRAHH